MMAYWHIGVLVFFPFGNFSLIHDVYVTNTTPFLKEFPFVINKILVAERSRNQRSRSQVFRRREIGERKSVFVELRADSLQGQGSAGAVFG